MRRSLSIPYKIYFADDIQRDYYSTLRSKDNCRWWYCDSWRRITYISVGYSTIISSCLFSPWCNRNVTCHTNAGSSSNADTLGSTSRVIQIFLFSRVWLLGWFSWIILYGRTIYQSFWLEKPIYYGRREQYINRPTI